MVKDTVESIHIFPIKGFGEATVEGQAPDELIAGLTGFEVHGVGDRDFVLYDPNAQCFVSQRGWNAEQRLRFRSDTQIAHTGVDIQPDHLAVTTGVGSLEIPTTDFQGARKRIDIFGNPFPVIDQRAEAGRYFTRLLGREVRLLRADPQSFRTLPDEYQRSDAHNLVAGADGMPFLLTNQASLAAAHKDQRVAAGTTPISRYRGNIVLSGEGLGAWGEDYIDPDQPFSIGSISMYGVKPCSRCPVPNVDQETGLVAGGALSLLRDRKGTIFTGEEGVFFGLNLAHRNVGYIAVGDEVAIPHLTTTPNINFSTAR